RARPYSRPARRSPRWTGLGPTPSSCRRGQRACRLGSRAVARAGSHIAAPPGAASAAGPAAAARGIACNGTSWRDPGPALRSVPSSDAVAAPASAPRSRRRDRSSPCSRAASPSASSADPAGCRLGTYTVRWTGTAPAGRRSRAPPGWWNCRLHRGTRRRPRPCSRPPSDQPPPRRRRAPAPQRRSATSLRVADAVDDPVLVVGHQHRAVLHHHDVVRPAPHRWIGLGVEQEAGQERLVLADLAAVIQHHAHHVVALLDRAVPRAAHRDEDVVLVLGREHLAAVEAHADRRDVRAELERRLVELAARAVLAELRIRR